MTGKQSRRKGHDFEREIAAELRRVMSGAVVRRGLQSRDGADVADVENPWFHIECKRSRAPVIGAAMEQARRDSSHGLSPVAITKGDRRPALVTMHLEDWLTLVRAAWECCAQYRGGEDEKIS